ncbi:MAG: hypothetical protein DRJ61_14100 [Acidobacteria bacterium]|nr:MAG: hypothetical protein DRJ65_21810 [Acidobacteriota bacterium]RLE29685.1 MAG: hypothetical protein DRJ61_14100 [Acidobacteriota bacterium]
MTNPVIFSLGRYCATAYQLRRLGLRLCAGPLDWMGSDDASGLYDLLEHGFDAMMDRSHLKIFGQHRGFWIVRDQRYRIRTAHDFPIDPKNHQATEESSPGLNSQCDPCLIRWLDQFLTNRRRHDPSYCIPVEDGNPVFLEDYSAGIRRIRRRSARLLSALNSRRAIVLVRNEDSMKEILRLHDLLCRIRDRRPFLLLATGPDPEFREDPGVADLATCWIPKVDSSQGPDSWQGDDRAWDNVPALITNRLGPG